MSMLYCYSEYRFQPDPDIIPYVLDVRPVVGFGLATLTSDDHMCTFDPERLGSGPTSMRYTPHGRTHIPVMRPFDIAVVATAGGDSAVSLWDLRVGSAVLPSLRLHGAPSPISALACERGSHAVAIGTELQDGLAATVVWDVRAAVEPMQLLGLHSDDVTDLEFDSVERSHLISGSVDGLVLTTDTLVIDEDEAVINTFNLGASIHRATRLQSDALLALSHDEQLAIWGPGTMMNFGDVRPILKCRYVCDAQVRPGGNGAVLGIGNASYTSFSLFNVTRCRHRGNSNQWGFERNTRCRLVGAHGDDIVRAFCFLEGREAVFTVGEDGWVRAWKPDEARWEEARRS